MLSRRFRVEKGLLQLPRLSYHIAPPMKYLSLFRPHRCDVFTGNNASEWLPSFSREWPNFDELAIFWQKSVNLSKSILNAAHVAVGETGSRCLTFCAGCGSRHAPLASTYRHHHSTEPWTHSARSGSTVCQSWDNGFS